MEYVLLVTEEIGQDKANDLSSIYHVRESPDGSSKRALLWRVHTQQNRA